MPGNPQLKKLDATSYLISDPYRFISRQAKALKSNVFEARLLFQKTIFMTGEEAAKIFTDEDLFTRKSAAPEPVRATLFGKGGIQGLDGEEHRHRKELFMSFMTGDNADELQNILRKWFDRYSTKWEQMDEIKLYPEFQEVLTRTVCDWSGVKLREDEVRQKTHDLSSLFDYAGSIRHHFAARSARKRSEEWIEKLILEARKGGGISGTPLSVFAHFRDLNGRLLDAHVAAVDFLSILRPTIAVSVFFLYVIHALHLDSDSRQRIKAQEAGFMDFFINEVRRFYPFFPFSVARVKTDFKWGRIDFTKGKRVILDLYGINHDERIWQRPCEFNPDRFKNMKITPFNFVPQGVGDHRLDHRCPGELFTIELMRSAADYFVNYLNYDVPAQALQINFARLPAIPESHLVIKNVRKTAPFIFSAATPEIHPGSEL